MYSNCEWILVEKEVDLEETLFSGQIFNFIKVEDEFCGFVGENLLIFRQNEKFFEFLKISENTKNTVWSFFNLDIEQTKCAHFIPGLRLITNCFVATTFSFICSQNNTVKRITKMVQFLHSKGDFVTYKNTKIYKFMDITRIEPNNYCAFEKELTENGFGYRSKYIIDCIRCFNNNSVYELENIGTMDYLKAREELLKIKGIGKKVADCICLMSLKHFHVVPIDTHVMKYSQLTFCVKKTSKYENIQKLWIEKYGEYAGIVQLHIFKTYLDKSKTPPIKTNKM